MNIKLRNYFNFSTSGKIKLINSLSLICLQFLIMTGSSIMKTHASLFFILLSLMFSLSYGQKQETSNSVLPRLKVDNWQMEQGLPVNSIITVSQTADGWMFFGTEEGLVRFDGNTFFLMNRSNIPELNVNFISTLLGTSDSSLWVGTEGDGLIRYKDNAFFKYNKSTGLSSDRVYTLIDDSNGGLWIGTSGGGLNYIKNEKIIGYDTKNGLASDYIRAFAIDSKGRLWVGTQKGLSVIDNGQIKNYYKKDGLSDDFIETLAFDKEQNLWIGTKSGGLNVLKQDKFTVYTVKDGLTENAITKLCFDTNGILWIGTNGGGITLMKDGKFHSLTTKEGLSSDLIATLFEDREGNIWAGSSGAGIDRIKMKLIQTISIREGLPGDAILPIFEDHAGVLWLGVAGKGLNKLENGKVHTFTKKDGLPEHFVLAIDEDLNRTLWIGTAGGGLTSFKDNKFTSYSSANGLSNNVVIAIYCDKSGAIWAGTTGGGINSYKNSKFTAFTTKEGLSNDNVTCILEDIKGNLWVGTNDGLNIIKDNKISIISQKDGLSDDYILSLYEDKEGNLWVGTAGNGLNLIRNGKISQFTAKDGLINEVVLKILEDEFGYFWISCNKGIYKIKKSDLIDFADLKLNSLNSISYGKTDGMETIECNGGVSPAGFKTRDGKLLFPTMKGVAVIDPELMKTANSYFSTIYVEEFLVDGQPMKITNPLSISSYTNRLEFRYSALNYSNPEKIKYRCMLVGFDKDWIDCGTRKSAYYTNISGGDYVFRVMASNEAGQWDDRVFTELKFHQETPFYKSNLFYLIGVIFFLLLIFFIIYYFMERLHRKQLKILVEERTLELHQKIEAQKQTQEKLQRTNTKLLIAKNKAEESDRLKSSFLANMSHEIRTPLNGILGFSELLKEPKLTGEEQQNYIRIIEKSGNRMLNTITDIISISKLESGQMEISISGTNINEQLEYIYNFLSPGAKKKGISISFQNSLPAPEAFIKTDREKIFSILSNLVINAIKFTNAGSVEFGYEKKDKNLEFYVKDSGIGIPLEQRELIFDKFRQGSEGLSRGYEGSGLGLSLSKAYVELLGGIMWVESELGKGSTFYFTIPYIIDRSQLSVENNQLSVDDDHNIQIQESETPEIKKLKILIAEDDETSMIFLATFIKMFSKEILYARTGEEAVEICKNNTDIDLVLMDIKMPNMNGYDATKQIRQINKDVIIIAQTAFALKSDREKALASGCNDYISKPFKIELLAEMIIKHIS